MSSPTPSPSPTPANPGASDAPATDGALTPLPPAHTSPIRAVLLDADGVLQLIGTPWIVALDQGGGPGFAKELLAGEQAALSGQESLSSVLTRLRHKLRIPHSTEELMAIWWRATPDPVAWALVRELRSLGYLTVLATNQQWERRAWMSERLGYKGLCDVDAYSCDLRAAKPDPEYFLRVLRRIGIPVEEAATALFVDDNAENIAAAQALGISTIHHPVDAGGAVLRTELLEALAPKD